MAEMKGIRATRMDLIRWDGAKARPVAGRLRHFADSRRWAAFPKLADALRAGIPWRQENVRLAPCAFKNSPACLLHEDFVDKEISALLATTALRLYDAEIIKKYGLPICIMPLHVVEQSSGLRLVFDARLSNMADGDGAVVYENLEEFLQTALEGELIAKVDFRSGYHHLPIPEKDAPFVAVEWKGRLMFWSCVFFGLRSAPKWFTSFTAPLASRLRAMGFSLMVYIDDLIFLMGLHKERAEAKFEEAIKEITEWGWVLALEKLTTPAQRAVALGLQVDSTKGTVSCTTARKEKVMHAVAALRQSSCAATTISALAGFLTASIPALKYARAWARPLHNALASFDQEELGSVSCPVDGQLAELPDILEGNWDWLDGCLLHPPPADFTLSADSTTTNFASGIAAGTYKLISKDSMEATMLRAGEWEESAGQHIAVLELRVQVENLEAFADRLKGRVVEIITDNATTFFYIRKGGGHVPCLQDLTWRLFKCLTRHKIVLAAVSWIPSATNDFMDSLTREDAEKETEIHPDSFQWILTTIASKGAPIPTCDGMATARSRKLPAFISRFWEPGCLDVDLFSAKKAKDHILWLNPPWPLISKTLAHVAKAQLKAYILIPHWKALRPAWERAKLSFVVPLGLPPCRGVVSRLPQPHGLLRVMSWPPDFPQPPSSPPPATL
jgi:hypothetical protein